MDDLPAYAELHCLSCFSFLRGASRPEELVERAAALGYTALAITDEASLAGVVRAHEAARAAGIKLLVGAEFALADGPRLVLIAANTAGYGNLASLVTLARRRAAKGGYRLLRGDLETLGASGAVPDCLALWLPAPEQAAADAAADGAWLRTRFPGRLWIGVELLCGPDDAGWLACLQALGAACGLPLVAAGDVHMHVRGRRPLQDVLTALRLRTTVAAAGQALFANGERHLRTRLRLGRLYPPALLAETVALAARCTFSLDALRYEYPVEDVPEGYTPAAWLRHETFAGLARRYPGGVPGTVAERAGEELSIIGALGYEAYFLTVYDIVRFARGAGILCQGRGSAANSVVCYALGITEVDPAQSALLFARFLSRERGEPPDIDVDFEHERREEVIQYVYARYGRERAALAGALITWRTRGALRDVGRALGFSPRQIGALTGSLAWWDRREALPARCAAVGLDPEAPRVRQWLALAGALHGMPRHLSQHVGGFVIARGPLARLVPVENAAMPGRTVLQWDKDDLDALGILKVDLLALGMLSALRRGLALCGHTPATVPREDPAVYAMIGRADTIGVFQIESRAQMSMLPRLRPRTFYDLVIEVALVRPGPIQGDMVHPYLRRRAGTEAIEPMTPAVAGVLGRTLGVPIFQEQVMQLAMVAAGFSAGEADALRRAMAAWRRKGGIGPFEARLAKGLADNGYDAAFAERLIRQIRGFGEYGFPESHAASFAHLVYLSAWLKCHHPDAFLCALLNSQPMGFYAPAQLVADARRHGVRVLPADVTASAVESIRAAPGCVRLGLGLIRGLTRRAAAAIAAARTAAPFADLGDLVRRAALSRADLDCLAAADALAPLAGHRRQAAWAAAAVPVQLDLLAGAEPAPAAPPAALAPAREGEEIRADYASLGLTLRRHPLAVLRPALARRRFAGIAELNAAPDRALLRVAGLVTCRQRPGTASGVIFVTLEDESGQGNVIVRAARAERDRRALLQGRLLGVFGQVQREGRVVHLIADRLVDLSAWLGPLPVASRDFH